MATRIKPTLWTLGSFALLQALVLGGLLITDNAPMPPLAVWELGLVLVWLSLAVNVAFAAMLAVGWWPLRRWAGWTTTDWPTYLVSGLVGLHLGWAILNRLTLAQTWIRPPRFLTLPGLVQLLALLALILCVMVAGVWLRKPGRRLASVLLLGSAAVLAGSCLVWNARMEVFDRTYDLDVIRIAAESGLDPTAAAEPAGESDRVVVLALDGLSWGVMKPLLEAGRLPHFSRLIAGGSIGYLDNGDASLSPPIWNTIFTGRPPDEHGIHEFRRPTLRFSGQAIDSLLMMPPTLHSFYGLRHLLSVIPGLGLWRMESSGPRDLDAKTLWAVASSYDQRVVVTNPITSLPVQPVNGQMLAFRDSGDPLTSFPPSLAAEWREEAATAGLTPGDWRSYRAEPGKLLERTRREAGFALELFAREHFDLAVYYDKVVDEMSHLAWDFHARGDTVLTRLPYRLRTEEWERLVLEFADHPVFRSYADLDAIVGRFVERFPANFLVVSDHGWTYSGFEHYGSQEGVVILFGPQFRPGANLTGAKIEDVAPTVVSLLGLPLSRELEGRPLLDALKVPPELAYVESYGRPVISRHSTPGAVDEEELERLEALGYAQ